MSQTAASLLALTMSDEIPFIIAINVASASASDTLVEIPIPSHQSVDAGRVSLPQVGAAVKTVLDETPSAEPSPSRTAPPREPHIVASAKLPASHSACVAFES